MLMVIISLIVILFLYWIFQTKCSNRTLQKCSRSMPPGPRGLPIIGYIPFLTSKPYVKLDELKKIYGPVYSLKLGRKNVVTLCDFPSIKNAFSNDAFMGRPIELPFELSKMTLETEAFTGMPWKEQRRFCLHMLRDLGFGKTRMEAHIKEEINELLDRLVKVNGHPIKMSEYLSPSMSNNIASLMFGRRLKYNDPKRINLDKLVNLISLLAGQVSWQIFFPTLKAIFRYFRIGNTKTLSDALEQLRVYVRQEVDKHEETFDENNVRDLIDCYLVEMKKRNDKPNSTFKRDIMVDLVRSFFAAGSITVRITVDWLLLTMAAYPEVQKKVQGEIYDVIGSEGFPTRADYAKMPYTEATIMEVMRWQTIVPVNILRSTLVDTELNGYSVPKSSFVIANLWSVMHDPQIWGEDVKSFKPERFITDDGKGILKPEFFIPFSIGKRACPGEPLAKVEIFLYFVSILQKFNIRFPPGKIVDFEGIHGIGLQPKKQEIYLEIRQY